MTTLIETQDERRARIRLGRLEAFEEGLRYHLANGPETWSVVKKTDRLWYVINASGDMVQSAHSKRRALELLNGSHYEKIWREKDEWYRGTSRDPRNRSFAEDEQDIISRVLGEA